MKTIITLFIIILSLNAQNQNISVFGAINRSFPDIESKESDPLDIEADFSFEFGLSYAHPINSDAAIKLQTSYLRETVTSDMNFTEANIKTNRHIDYHLDYINTAILFQYKLSKKIGLIFGPSIAFEIDSESKTTTTETNLNTNVKTENTKTSSPDDINDIISLQAGLSYYLNDAIFIETSYSYDFTNVEDNKNDLTNKIHNVKIGLGYSF